MMSVDRRDSRWIPLLATVCLAGWALVRAASILTAVPLLAWGHEGGVVPPTALPQVLSYQGLDGASDVSVAVFPLWLRTIAVLSILLMAAMAIECVRGSWTVAERILADRPFEHSVIDRLRQMAKRLWLLAAARFGVDVVVLLVLGVGGAGGSERWRMGSIGINVPALSLGFVATAFAAWILARAFAHGRRLEQAQVSVGV